MQGIPQIDPSRAPKEVAAIVAARFSDEDVIEFFGSVAVTLFTPPFNHLAATEIDFPRVSSVTGAA